jgi:hypothetical protein
VAQVQEWRKKSNQLWAWIHARAALKAMYPDACFAMKQVPLDTTHASRHKPRHDACYACDGNDTSCATLQVVRPRPLVERPYRVEAVSGAHQVPLPARSMLSKISQYVLGL